MHLIFIALGMSTNGYISSLANYPCNSNLFVLYTVLDTATEEGTP